MAALMGRIGIGGGGTGGVIQAGPEKGAAEPAPAATTISAGAAEDIDFEAEAQARGMRLVACTRVGKLKAKQILTVVRLFFPRPKVLQGKPNERSLLRVQVCRVFLLCTYLYCRHDE